MEKVVSRKLEDYILNVKEAIQLKLQDVKDTPNIRQLWDYINHYEKMTVTANDLARKTPLEKLNTKIQTYFKEFRENIRDKMSELDLNLPAFSQYIEEAGVKGTIFTDTCVGASTLILTTEDLAKRKRQQNTVPAANRCMARLKDNKQCTRKRVFTHNVCGTHLKLLPYGLMDCDPGESLCQIEIHSIDIRGITYFVDSCNNVYDHIDVLSNKLNPRIIAKAVVIEDGTLHIPELGI